MKALLDSTWNSPNQQWGWVGTGRVLPYDLFEFALKRVAAKSKGFLKQGAASTNVLPRRLMEMFLPIIVFLKLRGFKMKKKNNKKINHKKKKACKTPGSSAVPRKTLPSFPQTQSGAVCTACLLCVAAWPFLFS